LTGSKPLSKFGEAFGQDYKGISWLGGLDLGLAALKEIEDQRTIDRKDFEENLDKEIQNSERNFYLDKFEKASPSEDSSSDL
jgi:hypothetical protein